METQWAENRAKLPHDFIRRSIGRAFDNLYSTGERDKFRTRIERTPAGGSEIYLSHRGAVEVYSDVQRTQTVWQPRPSDQQLEAEMLSRIMVKLGAKEEQAKAAAATAVAAPEAPVAAPAGPPARRPAGGVAAGRRRFRPCLAPRRSGARPQRLHGRRPRPLAGPVLRPLCRPGAPRPPGARLLRQAAQLRPPRWRRDRRSGALPRQRQVRGPVVDRRLGARRQGRSGERRYRQAHRQTAGRRVEVTAAGAAPARPSPDALLQPGQRQRRQCAGGRGGQRRHHHPAAGRLRLLAARTRRPAGARRPRREPARRGLHHPRARRPCRRRASRWPGASGCRSG